jgi:hypothetical protein
VIDPHQSTQVADRRRIEAADADPCPVAVLDEAVEAGKMTPGRAAPRDHEREHPVGLQTPEREHQRLQRRSIRPLGVVDQEQHRPSLLHLSQELEKIRANPDGVASLIGSITEIRQCPSSPERGGADQLLDDTKGEQLLRLLSTGLPELKPVGLADEAMRERGLADSRLAGEQGDSWMPGSHLGRLREQAGQLVPSPDECRIDPASVTRHGDRCYSPCTPDIFGYPAKGHRAAPSSRDIPRAASTTAIESP